MRLVRTPVTWRGHLWGRGLSTHRVCSPHTSRVRHAWMTVVTVLCAPRVLRTHWSCNGGVSLLTQVSPFPCPPPRPGAPPLCSLAACLPSVRGRPHGLCLPGPGWCHLASLTRSQFLAAHLAGGAGSELGRAWPPGTAGAGPAPVVSPPPPQPPGHALQAGGGSEYSRTLRRDLGPHRSRGRRESRGALRFRPLVGHRVTSSLRYRP